MSVYTIGGGSQSHEIILNVYDLTPSSSLSKTFLGILGVGFYHSGIEINGVEYTYGGNFTHNGTGMYTQAPLQTGAENVLYKESFLLGEIKDFTKI